MKLNCNVEVQNRAVPSPLRRRSQNTVLTFGRNHNKGDLYIILQTLQNKQGTKYKIFDNVVRVFTRFIDNGKATIRLIEPCHDLIIQSDPFELKNFLRLLKLGLSNELDPSDLIISNLNSKSIHTTNFRIMIKSNSEYPTLKGFPTKTQELILCGLNRRNFDRQILTLKNLRILDVSNNQLVSLPKELGCLQHLQQLYLSHNYLGKANKPKWMWLNEVAIRYSLCLLHIDNNFFTSLPCQIGNLQALETLKVSENLLTTLPQSLGRLHNLKYLSLAKNNLTCLPGSIRLLRLIELDISFNAFNEAESAYERWYCSVPSLVESSARVFLKTRMPYDSSIIPSVLVKHLDEAKYCCKCGTACLEYFIEKYVELDLENLCSGLKTTLNTSVKFDCFLCSAICYHYFRAFCQ